MITIRVFRRIGDAPASGVKVTISAAGHTSARTNSDGSADFDLPGGRDYKVYVDGKQIYHGSIAGVQTVYI